MRRTAFALLLFAAACSQEVATTTPTPAAPAHHPVSTTAAPHFALVDPLASRDRASAGRSVFAYREVKHEVAKSRGREVAAAPAPQSSIPATPQLLRDPETSRPRDPFPYRAIGRLGPDGEQLVAFVIDGEVKLARAGEVVAGRYIVRAVGIESVEMALLSAPEVRWTLELGK